MAETKPLQLPDTISVRTLAGLISQSPTVVISKLIKNGVMATINQDIDYDTAALLVEEFGFTAEPAVEDKAVKKTTDSRNATVRAPIVTIMGHVDHGKTSLLDHIRRANVAAGEAGGITQNISAYQIEHAAKDGEKRSITFVDTPGHEAFSALRAHGATLTDIVILVVAADDGVKPQTIEAIKHAKQANVPIIVAINKTDLPGANPERVKQQLSEQELTPEEWGGKTVMLPISAKTGAGVDELLEYILLTADLLELKADTESSAEGIVIEANLDKQVGPLATVLVYNGTLRAGQVVVVGQTYGRIRALENDRGVKIASAGPAKPVRLIGLKSVPQFGERLSAVPNEKVARSMTQTSGANQKGGIGEDENTYNIILKADVGGSLAALEDSLAKLRHKDARVAVISSGIGQVTDNDIQLAKTSGALVVSFRLTPAKRLKDLAEKESVILKEEWIIYNVLEFITSELKRIATPTFITTELGRLKVLEVFSTKGKLSIVGGEVTQGELKPGLDVVIYRNKEEVGKAKLLGIKTGKIDADHVEAGTQCGLSIEGDLIEKGDILAATQTVEE